MVHGLWFMVHGSVHGVVVYGLVDDLVQLFETILDNVLLEHGGLPRIFPLTVH